MKKIPVTLNFNNQVQIGTLYIRESAIGLEVLNGFIRGDYGLAPAFTVERNGSLNLDGAAFVIASQIMTAEKRKSTIKSILEEKNAPQS